MFRDFNNDAWLDLLITGAKTRFYRNRGDGRFQEMGGLFTSGYMESCAIGDHEP
ncbi:MAG: FG-GAP repeat domain-containing protein [Verrucomicrobiales bacterium]